MLSVDVLRFYWANKMVVKKFYIFTTTVGAFAQREGKSGLCIALSLSPAARKIAFDCASKMSQERSGKEEVNSKDILTNVISRFYIVDKPQQLHRKSFYAFPGMQVVFASRLSLPPESRSCLIA
jgi:hypothetical protein